MIWSENEEGFWGAGNVLYHELHEPCRGYMVIVMYT